MQYEPRPATHMEKQSVGPKLGWVESLGISKAGQMVLARLIESQIWHHLASSMVLLAGGFRKETMASAALMPDGSVSPCVLLLPFKLLPQCWSSDGVSLSR